MAFRAGFVLCSTLLVITILGIAIRRKFFHPLSRFPGPFVASITSLYDAYHYATGRQRQNHLDLHRRYGSVVRYGPNHIIVSDPTMLPEIYSMKADKTDFYNSSLNEASQSVFSEKGHAAHIAARRSLAHAYSMSNVKAMEPQIQETIELWVTRLCTAEDGAFLLYDRVLWLAYDIIGIMTTGQPFGFVQQWTDVRAMLERASKSTTSGAYLEIVNRLPILSRFARETRLGRWMLLPWPTDKVGLGVLKAERDAAWTRYFENQHEQSATSAHCLLSQMLNKKRATPKPFNVEEEEEERLSNEGRIKTELLIAILAGTTTTATVITTAILNITAQPKFHEQLTQEILTSSSSSPPPQQSYLSASILESFRLSASPTQLPRLITSTNNLLFPPGTIASSSSYIISRNPELYGSNDDDLETFVPERWIFVGAMTEPEIQKLRKKYDFRFGYGARTCLGKHLVNLEIERTLREVFGGRVDVKLCGEGRVEMKMKMMR